MSILRRARFWLRSMRRKQEFRRTYARDSVTAKPGPHSLVIVLDHLRPVGNAGAIVRSADGFGARAVYVVGTDHFNAGPAMNSLRNVPIRFFERFEDAHESLVAEGYTLFALEPARNYEKPTFLHETTFPEKTAFVVGHETRGISFRPDELEHVVSLTIAQYGVVPCLNVSVAAGVAMYEYARQHGKPGSPR